MTRKRFIKLLMSYRIPRNHAVKIAADYNSRNIPYEIALVNYRSLLFSRLVYLREHSALYKLGRWNMEEGANDGNI